MRSLPPLLWSRRPRACTCHQQAPDTDSAWRAGASPLPDKALLHERASPIALAKAIKNADELAGMVEAHLRDAVPLAQTLHWLEQQARPQAAPVLALEAGASGMDFGIVWP